MGICTIYCQGAFNHNTDDVKVVHFENKEELSEYLFPYMHKDCMLLVKGSRGMKLDELVNVLIEKIRNKEVGIKWKSYV